MLLLRGCVGAPFMSGGSWLAKAAKDDSSLPRFSAGLLSSTDRRACVAQALGMTCSAADGLAVLPRCLCAWLSAH